MSFKKYNRHININNLCTSSIRSRILNKFIRPGKLRRTKFNNSFLTGINNRKSFFKRKKDSSVDTGVINNYDLVQNENFVKNGNNYFSEIFTPGNNKKKDSVQIKQDIQDDIILNKNKSYKIDREIEEKISKLLKSKKGNLLSSNVKDKISKSKLIDLNNLNKIRIHIDSTSAMIARKLKARAFTVKNNIFFGSGQFNTDKKEGISLITHEITHVSQQDKFRNDISNGKIERKKVNLLENRALINEKKMILQKSNIKNESKSQLNYNKVKNNNVNQTEFLPLYSPINKQNILIQKADEEAVKNTSSSSDNNIQNNNNNNLLDYKKIANEVYRIIEKKIQIDKERTGG